MDITVRSRQIIKGPTITLDIASDKTWSDNPPMPNRLVFEKAFTAIGKTIMLIKVVATIFLHILIWSKDFVGLFYLLVSDLKISKLHYFITWIYVVNDQNKHRFDQREQSTNYFLTFHLKVPSVFYLKMGDNHGHDKRYAK